jgi:hypothetical protein
MEGSAPSNLQGERLSKTNQNCPITERKAQPGEREHRVLHIQFPENFHGLSHKASISQQDMAAKNRISSRDSTGSIWKRRHHTSHSLRVRP